MRGNFSPPIQVDHVWQHETQRVIALLVGRKCGGVTASIYGRQASILERKDITTKRDVASCLGVRSAGAESTLQT